MNKEIIKISGMNCAACSSRVEKALSKTEGITSASVNLAAKTASVEYDPEIIKLSEIEAVIEKTGYGIIRKEKKAGEDEHKLRKEKEIRILRQKLPRIGDFCRPFVIFSYGSHDSRYHASDPRVFRSSTTSVVLRDSSNDIVYTHSDCRK